MRYQAYIDESISEEGGTFVLAGYIASIDAWEAFSRDWERMLPHGLPDKDGNYYFKMSEMFLNSERKSRVSWFYRIIEQHVLGHVSAKINTTELKRAQSRIVVPDCLSPIDWGMYANPYYIVFRCLLDKFHLERHRIDWLIPKGEKIDFIFDERAEKRAIYSIWEDYLSNRSDEVREYYGASPRFEDDKKCLPLQAADFWAWWVRKWYEEGTPEKIPKRDFGIFQPDRESKKYLFVDIVFDEEALVDQFKRQVRREIGPDYPIYDVKF